ncbi:uncharacterized protein V1516DRAFT_673206 [Lipomyces oligophaga]|uniref:uncharacterized protein n=1 Tax=Lipomyces oligophaga TaxID=45792 RepID=UPI0034CF65FB
MTARRAMQTQHRVLSLLRLRLSLAHRLRYVGLCAHSQGVTLCQSYSSKAKHEPNYDPARKVSWLGQMFGYDLNDARGGWAARGTDELQDGYIPDSEWEALQELSALIRRLKADVENSAFDHFEEVEYEIKAAVDKVITNLPSEDLPEVHVRLISEAWKLLYNPRIGTASEPETSEETSIVTLEEAPRSVFSKDELKKILTLLAKHHSMSEYHILLGRVVYTNLMQFFTEDNIEVQEIFTTYIYLLSHNKADAEMILAFTELLRVVKQLSETTTIALVTIISTVSNEKIQKILVALLFNAKVLDIGSFNIILQAALERDSTNLWDLCTRVLGFSPQYGFRGALEPSIDTYELLFRYVAKGVEPQKSAEFMKVARQIMFETDVEVPAYPIGEFQSLYRSYLTACLVVHDRDSGNLLAKFFNDDDVLPLLDVDTWNVWIQWVASFGKIELVRKQLQLAAEHEIELSTDLLNGIMRASQFGQDNAKFRNAIFTLFDQYSVPLNAASVSLRIRDRLLAKDVRGAIHIFNRSKSEGISWDPKEDDVAALFMMLDSVAKLSSNEFDAIVLTELYMNVRLFVNHVDYPTRLSIATAFLKHAEFSTLSDFLDQEMGEFQFEPSAFIELYDSLLTAIIESNSYRDAFSVLATLRKHFVIKYESYSPLIIKFSRLDHPKDGLELFRHLRKSTKTPPQRDVYAASLRAFARSKYNAGIEELMLCYQLDLNVDPDIEMFNALLEASAQIRDEYYAYTVWQQIRMADSADSVKDLVSGKVLDRHPNSETFSLLLRVAAYKSGGGFADELWQQFGTYPDIPITLEHYKFLVAAHAGFASYDKAFRILNRVYQRDPHIPPATSPYFKSTERETTIAQVIEVLYNMLSRGDAPPWYQQALEKWAKEKWPEEWAKVRKMPYFLQELDLSEMNMAGNEEAIKRELDKSGTRLDPADMIDGYYSKPLNLSTEEGEDSLRPQKLASSEMKLDKQPELEPVQIKR